MRLNGRGLAAALAIATIGSATSPAQAETNPTTVEVRVNSAGLDLTTEAGADEFLKRLSRAASRACGGRPDVGPLILEARGRFEDCHAKAVSAAVEQANSAVLDRRFVSSPDAAYLKLAAE